MISRLVRKALRAWIGWRHAIRVERRMPELASLRKAEAEARRKHKPVKHIHETRRAIVRARLAEEARRAS